MKKKMLSGLMILMTTQAHALFIKPERCAHDSLSQWSEGQNISGTARGRNEWFKVCKSDSYDLIFPAGIELDPSSQGRRVYPTFAIPSKVTPNDFTITGYVAPTVPPTTADDPTCVVPAPNKMIGLCTSGCVTPETEVSTEEGYREIALLKQFNILNVEVPNLDKGNSSELMKVRSYISDKISTAQPILKITMEDGRILKTSLNHPLLTKQGEMKNAENLSVGGELVKEDGSSLRIVKIEKEIFNGKVQNLTIETSDLKKSMYLANGIVSGDKKFQDIEVSDFNRKQLREVSFDQR